DQAESNLFTTPDIQAQVLYYGFDSKKTKFTNGPSDPAGAHGYRLMTKHGTYACIFHVGPLPELREVEPNNDVAHAQAINLPIIINGMADSGDYDVFRFHASGGQTLVLDLIATRASSHLDGTLAILDDRGNELDFNDDHYIHKDPHLAFTVKKTGDYFVRVAASQEGGSRFGSYRLIAGAVPYISQVLPAGARRGVSATFRLAGLNLQGIDRLVLGESLAEGRVLETQPGWLTFQLSVPASVAPGRYELHAFAGSLEAPLGIPLLISNLDEKLATPARVRNNPQVLTLPGAVSGTLDRRRTQHFFAFDVAAGDRITFDVDSMKLGYLDDPVLGLYTPDGTLLNFADDRLQQNGNQPPNLDPYMVHTFEKSGRYVLMIRDSAERGDPDYVYRLAIARIEPDFEVLTQTAQTTWFRGQTGFLPARVRRNGGWDTPVEVWAENLPPGITSDKVTVEPKDTILKDNCALNRRMDGTDVKIPFHIAPGARPGVYPIRLRARGTMDDKTVERTAMVCYEWESVGKISGPTPEQKLLAAVTDLPPVVLEPPESLALLVGKPSRMRVLVKRFDGGKTPLILEPEPAAPGVKFENNVLEPGATQVDLRVTASGKVEPGWFHLRAGDAVSPPIELKSEDAKDEE
ncbi:MAG: putative pre-peptidase, partial [Bryobacterales bacterium]|nr:putative pre-peptidase [Bryobacterales bacterium]